DGRSCATDIAQVLEVPVSTVTRALRRMEGYGYLRVRKGWFLDARVLRPELTLLGRQIAENVAGFERDIDGVLLAGISQSAFAGLLAGLVHINRTAAARMAGSPPGGLDPRVANSRARTRPAARPPPPPTSASRR